MTTYLPLIEVVNTGGGPLHYLVGWSCGPYAVGFVKMEWGVYVG